MARRIRRVRVTARSRVLKKCSTRRQRAAVSRKIRILIHEGYPVKQAAAIAYSMCRRRRK